MDAPVVLIDWLIMEETRSLMTTEPDLLLVEDCGFLLLDFLFGEDLVLLFDSSAVAASGSSAFEGVGRFSCWFDFLFIDAHLESASLPPS